MRTTVTTRLVEVVVPVHNEQPAPRDSVNRLHDSTLVAGLAGPAAYALRPSGGSRSPCPRAGCAT
ncbi:hypothetical protein [Nonomuraea sp. LPB2021202275-12-8]|uniref:hypothetical protein n=1 Tax=Nonomuraea sp. LPB2021202275-12-8 TaxID=3120159 RepID=UPI00300C3760